MARIITLGVGVSCSDGSVGGQKSSFAWDEKVWAGYKAEHSPGRKKVSVSWRRKERETYVEKKRHDHWGEAGWTRTSVCAWILKYTPGEWRAYFLLDDVEMGFKDFTIKPKITLAKIYGHVVNENTGAGLFNALVSFGGVSTHTNLLGYYELINFELVSSILKAELNGYEPAEYSITAPSDMDLVMNAFLTPIAPLEPKPEPEPPKTEFLEKWGSMWENVKEGKWLDASINLISLPFASMIPGDVEVVNLVIPIGPAPSGIDPSIILKLGPRLSMWGKISNIIKNLASQAKKNPLIAIFAATEIPQMIVMSTFAFKWFATQKGESQTGVSVTLGSLTKSWESAGYEYRDAVKAGNWGTANTILTNMMRVAAEYNNLVEEKKDVLTKAGEYEARKAIGDMMTTSNEAMKTEITPHIEKITAEIPETFTAKVREIIDGDSIQARWEEGELTLETRLVGINTPEQGEIGKKESKDWLAKEIYGQDVILKVDPANVRDQYGRILATIFFNNENINLKSIKEGWAFFYPYDENKYVNSLEYAAAETKAKEEKKGIWGLLGKVGEIKVNSSPSNVAIFLDGINTGFFTAEILKDISIGLHTVRLELDGHNPYEIEVDVKEDERVEIYKELVEIGLEEEVGEIGVSSKPTRAKIFLDGNDTGLLTAETLKDIPVGKHKINLELEGYFPYEEEVEVKKDEKVEVYKEWVTAVPETGTIKIYSKPAYCEIWIDGEDTGRLAIDSFDLEKGIYLFEVKKEGYITASEEIEIKVGDDLERRFELEEGVEEEIPPEVPEVPPEEETALEKSLREMVTSLTATINDLRKEIAELKGEAPPPEIPPEIPPEYTPEQEWALKEAFGKIWGLIEGKEIMSGAERSSLIASFNMYTSSQKEVLSMLWKDVKTLTKGRAQMSQAEFFELKERFGV